MASIGLAFDVNMCFLAESTVVSSLPRSYIGTTYDSSTDMQTLSKLVGRVTSLAKTSVAALNDLHVSKAVFLPFPANDETVTTGEGVEHGKSLCFLCTQRGGNFMRWYVPQVFTRAKRYPQLCVLH